MLARSPAADSITSVEDSSRVGSAEALATRAASSLHLLRVRERQVVGGRIPNLKSGALTAAEGYDQLVAAIRTHGALLDTAGCAAGQARNAELDEAVRRVSAKKDGTLTTLQEEQRKVRGACRSGAEVKVDARDEARNELRVVCVAGIAIIRGKLLADAGPHEIAPEKTILSAVQRATTSMKEGMIAAFGQDFPDTLESVDEGSSVAVDVWDEGRISEVLRAYSQWVDRCDGSELARVTDEAVKRVKAVPLAAFFGAEDASLDTSDGDDALCALGTALDKEEEWQQRDHLGCLPRAELLGCAGSLLRVLEERARTLQRAVQICTELSEHISVQSAALDGRSAVRTALQEELRTLEERSSAVQGVKDDVQDAETALQRARRRGACVTALTAALQAAKVQFKAARALLQAALSAVQAREREFPEVIGAVQRAVGLLEEGIGQGLTRGVAEMREPAAESLAASEEQHLLSLPPSSRHIVRKVREGADCFAVKEFSMSAGEIEKSLKDARLLLSLRHPDISELQAVSFDTPSSPAKLFLQLPLYPNGQLDHSVEHRAPAWSAVHLSLADVHAALAHMHALQVVHADANILVDARERIRLADLDVSVDAATRVSTSHATRTLAFSAGFCAPEVPAHGSSPASDVFAVGRTAASPVIRAACERKEEEEEEEESVGALVGAKRRRVVVSSSGTHDMLGGPLDEQRAALTLKLLHGVARTEAGRTLLSLACNSNKRCRFSFSEPESIPAALREQVLARLTYDPSIRGTANRSQHTLPARDNMPPMIESLCSAGLLDGFSGCTTEVCQTEAGGCVLRTTCVLDGERVRWDRKACTSCGSCFSRFMYEGNKYAEFKHITKDMAAGQRDWSELVGHTLCESCYRCFTKYGHLKNPRRVDLDSLSDILHHAAYSSTVAGPQSKSRSRRGAARR